jgi:hypothetical protein
MRYQIDVVYLMGNKNWNVYKIGRSRDPETRLRQFKNLPFRLEIMASVPCECGLYVAQLTEHLMHIHFNNRRIEGEWFRNITVDDFCTVGNRIEREVHCQWQRFGLKMFRGYTTGTRTLNKRFPITATEPPLQGVSGVGGVCIEVHGSESKNTLNAVESTDIFTARSLPGGSESQEKS